MRNKAGKSVLILGDVHFIDPSLYKLSGYGKESIGKASSFANSDDAEVKTIFAKEQAQVDVFGKFILNSNKKRLVLYESSSSLASDIQKLTLLTGNNSAAKGFLVNITTNLSQAPEYCSRAVFINFDQRKSAECVQPVVVLNSRCLPDPNMTAIALAGKLDDVFLKFDLTWETEMKRCLDICQDLVKKYKISQSFFSEYLDEIDILIKNLKNFEEFIQKESTKTPILRALLKNYFRNINEGNNAEPMKNFITLLHRIFMKSYGDLMVLKFLADSLEKRDEIVLVCGVGHVESTVKFLKTIEFNTVDSHDSKKSENGAPVPVSAECMTNILNKFNIGDLVPSSSSSNLK